MLGSTDPHHCPTEPPLFSRPPRGACAGSAGQWGARWGGGSPGGGGGSPGGGGGSPGGDGGSPGGGGQGHREAAAAPPGRAEAALGARMPQPLQPLRAARRGQSNCKGWRQRRSAFRSRPGVPFFFFFFFLFLRSGREGINAERAAKQRQQHLGSRVREAGKADAITSEFI